MTDVPDMRAAREIERLLRREWWLNHGHGAASLYGDDGEMQCFRCVVDYGRSPIRDLYRHVMTRRMVNGDG